MWHVKVQDWATCKCLRWKWLWWAKRHRGNIKDTKQWTEENYIQLKQMVECRQLWKRITEWIDNHKRRFRNKTRHVVRRYLDAVQRSLPKRPVPGYSKATLTLQNRSRGVNEWRIARYIDRTISECRPPARLTSRNVTDLVDSHRPASRGGNSAMTSPEVTWLSCSAHVRCRSTLLSLRANVATKHTYMGWKSAHILDKIFIQIYNRQRSKRYNAIAILNTLYSVVFFVSISGTGGDMSARATKSDTKHIDVHNFWPKVKLYFTPIGLHNVKLRTLYSKV